MTECRISPSCRTALSAREHAGPLGEWIVKLSATGSKFKVPQVLSRTEIKNLTRPGVNKRQVSF